MNHPVISPQVTAELVCRAIVAAMDDKTVVPKLTDRLLEDLGFDSLRIATLALTLEDELGQPVLLSDWLAGIGDIDNLQVQSLVDFLTEAPLP